MLDLQQDKLRDSGKVVLGMKDDLWPSIHAYASIPQQLPAVC